MYDKVRDIEKNLASSRATLEKLVERLTDESIYADPGRKDELTKLVQDQTDTKSVIEKLEWNWLEASEKLEKAN